MIKVNRVSHEKEGRLSEIQFSAQLRYLSLRDFLEFNSLLFTNIRGKIAFVSIELGTFSAEIKLIRFKKV